MVFYAAKFVVLGQAAIENYHSPRSPFLHGKLAARRELQ